MHLLSSHYYKIQYYFFQDSSKRSNENGEENDTNKKQCLSLPIVKIADSVDEAHKTPHIIKLSGLLVESVNINENAFKVNVKVFYCKLCSLILNEENEVTCHLAASSHTEKCSNKVIFPG